MLREVIAIPLTEAFENDAPIAVLGQTISIGYKNGRYHVTKYDHIEQTFTTISYNFAELDKAIDYFLDLYEDDPIGNLKAFNFTT